MKKVVCLHNVYYEGRYISAGVALGIPDEVACNWVKRGLAKFVGGETPVNPPAAKPIVKVDVPPFENPEVKPEEKAVVKYDFTTEIPKAEENAVIKENLTTEKTAIEETPVAVDDTPKRGRPPKKKHGGKRK